MPRWSLTFVRSVVMAAAFIVASIANGGAQTLEFTYQSGNGTIDLQATADFQSLTISGEHWFTYYEMTMHCPARKVVSTGWAANPTAYTYDCTMTIKGVGPAPSGVAGSTGSGTAHVALYLKPDPLGNDLTIKTDSFTITGPNNKGTFTEFASTSGWAKGASKKVKVKIATTKSCTDKAEGGFALQGGVVVKLGNQTYTSNANGVIEADLTPGTYSVDASWYDYAFGYVSENGARQKRNEDGKFQVRLSDQGETLEVRMLICDPDGQPKARATILQIGVTRAGPGSISVSRSKASGKGFVGMKLRDGDIVKIIGTAQLKWLEGGGTIAFDNPSTYTLITIGPESVPAGSKVPPTSSVSQSVMQVLQGIGEFVMPPNEDTDLPHDANGNAIKFGASSRTVAVGIKGTQFRFGYDPKTNSSPIVVEQGTVWVTPKNASLKPFTLQAGQQATVAQNRVSPITPVSGKVANPSPVRTSAPVAAASFGTPMYQSGRRDTNGRITVESATIYPFVCQGTSFYLYQYTARAAGEAQFRAIRPPDFSHPLGGKDFATRDQAVAAACAP